jgi:hypothetical protein
MTNLKNLKKMEIKNILFCFLLLQTPLHTQLTIYHTQALLLDTWAFIHKKKIIAAQTPHNLQSLN